MLRSQSKRPNKIEKEITDILNFEFKNQFRYVGNRDVFLGNPSKNPDWIHVSKNKVIEFFGRHWHENEDEQNFKNHYNGCGYDCLIIWEEELRDKNKMVQKIKNFIYNKKTEVVKIVSICKEKCYDDVYNLEVEDNNNYYAYGILVHNCAKAYSFWVSRNYREAYGMFICSGILFNHESERRGDTFVTKKIVNYVVDLKKRMDKKESYDKLKLGNLDAMRDWGYAKEYVEAMWMMLQHNIADDYVVATGETHSVREFCQEAFGYYGLDYNDFIEIDERFFRASEVDILIGDSSKIQRVLGWKSTIKFKELVRIMIEKNS
jgi:GDP-mannose 4,6-dehydratase